MFTGIVEETGVVDRIHCSTKAIAFSVLAGKTARNLKPGDSMAVNGCCLTVVKLTRHSKGKLLQFDLLRETWERTSFPSLRRGSAVNLERALRADGRVDGHFVTGHIDSTGTILRWERAGQDRVLEIAAPPHVLRYVVSKGSIAVDGISLTVAAAHQKSFRVWIIPHTYEMTALRERALGDAVNLETDILGKYVERFAGRRGRP